MCASGQLSKERKNERRQVIFISLCPDGDVRVGQIPDQQGLVSGQDQAQARFGCDHTYSHTRTHTLMHQMSDRHNSLCLCLCFGRRNTFIRTGLVPVFSLFFSSYSSRTRSLYSLLLPSFLSSSPHLSLHPHFLFSGS